METTEKNHAIENAKNWLAEIVTMTRALDLRTFAEDWVARLDASRVEQLLEDMEVEIDTDADTNRETLVQAIVDGEEPSGFEYEGEDTARETIEESVLSVEVRGDWYCPGGDGDTGPSEFRILLTTGGPALQIVGELDGGQPSRPRLQYQDWGTPWTEYLPLSREEREALDTFVGCFYFGE